MNYKVYNTDASNWCTYRRDSTGHYDLIREGLPTYIKEFEVGEPVYRYETKIKRSRDFNPWCKIRWFGDKYDYLFTEIETKTTKTRRDVFSNYRGRQIVRKCRPESTYRTEIYLNY